MMQASLIGMKNQKKPRDYPRDPKRDKNRKQDYSQNRKAKRGEYAD